jgi:hypothetical protein
MDLVIGTFIQHQTKGKEMTVETYLDVWGVFVDV